MHATRARWSTEMTETLARFAARRPWSMLAAWGGAVVLAVAAMAFLFAELDPEGHVTTQPESVRAEELREAYFAQHEIEGAPPTPVEHKSAPQARPEREPAGVR
jgi:hypothetical protein